jgi:hypothetical protein
MNWGASGEPFDSRDFVPLDLAGSHKTGANRVTIQKDSAGAAVAGVASDLGSH